MTFIDNVYRYDCDNSLVGRIEDIITMLLNWRIIKHTKDGNLIAPNKNMDKVFNENSFIGIKWEYANKRKTKIVYRFYMSSGYIDDMAKDILYLQKNGDLICESYRFGKLAFTYKGTKI